MDITLPLHDSPIISESEVNLLENCKIKNSNCQSDLYCCNDKEFMSFIKSKTSIQPDYFKSLPELGVGWCNANRLFLRLKIAKEFKII
jgi:hypothetical protein